MNHSIKCWPEYFAEVETGAKTFEIRKDDRGYKIGDIVDLCEYDPERKEATGKIIPVVITYVFNGEDEFPGADGWHPILPGYCVFSFRVLPDPEGAPV